MTTSFLPASELRGPSWLLDVLDDSPTVRRVHGWWQWAVLSLGCVSGCASWDQVADNAAQPLRATGNFLARTGDRVGDLFESNSTRHRNPANLPAHQGLTPVPTNQVASLQKAPTASATTQAGATLPTVSQPTAMQAIHKTPVANERPQESLTVPSAPPAAPPAVELLPAPPADLKPISNSRPASVVPATSSVARAEISTWCRVRIRNVSSQAVPQVAVTVNSPENANLVSKDGETVSAPTTGKMEFAPVTQVGSGEEVILVIGVAANGQQGHRLRVQVRDGLGGSNQDVQARWNVAIEAIE